MHPAQAVSLLPCLIFEKSQEVSVNDPLQFVDEEVPREAITEPDIAGLAFGGGHGAHGLSRSSWWDWMLAGLELHVLPGTVPPLTAPRHPGDTSKGEMLPLRASSGGFKEKV